jgi:hypothetical protein
VLIYQARKVSMYMCVRGRPIDFVSFYDFSIAFFGTVPTVWYALCLFLFLHTHI